MAASGLLRERDLRALTAVIEDGLRDDAGQAMPWAVLDRLRQLIPCDMVRFEEFDLQGHEQLTMQCVSDPRERLIRFGEPPDGDPQFWVLRGGFLPYNYWARTGDLSSVLRWSDFYTQSELRNAPFYKSLGSEHSTRYAILVSLPTGPGRNLRVGFWRSNRDFSERDRLALQLLRPHLHEVYRDAERRRRGIPQLSSREREVLQLASQGYSNADIARILFISVATVAKHMEHIFDRTGVRTRTAAVAVALPQISPFAGRPDTRR